jgi:hypothetical protein
MTINQIIAMVLVVLGVFTASAAQLTELLGPGLAKAIVSISSLLTSILSGWIGVFSGQAATLKQVQDMPGVDKIVVNKQANTTLATLAVDPTQPKIEASPEAEAKVQQTAASA